MCIWTKVWMSNWYYNSYILFHVCINRYIWCLTYYLYQCQDKIHLSAISLWIWEARTKNKTKIVGGSTFLGSNYFGVTTNVKWSMVIHAHQIYKYGVVNKTRPQPLEPIQQCTRCVLGKYLFLRTESNITHFSFFLFTYNL